MSCMPDCRSLGGHLTWCKLDVIAWCHKMMSCCSSFRNIFFNGSFSILFLSGSKISLALADFIPFVVLWPCAHICLVLHWLFFSLKSFKRLLNLKIFYSLFSETRRINSDLYDANLDVVQKFPFVYCFALFWWKHFKIILWSRNVLRIILMKHAHKIH